jgi:hypothetical protein
MPRTIIVGVGWYSADQWAMLKLAADDPETLDATYQQWCAGAEKTLQQVKSQPGVRAVKIPVDVQVLRQWCRDHGRPLDGAARAQFIAEAVKTTTVSEN